MTSNMSEPYSQTNGGSYSQSNAAPYSDNNASSYSTNNASSYSANNASSYSANNADSTTSVKDSMVNSAANAVNSIQNSQIANGPMATSVKNQASATSSEFSGLANSRETPSYTANNTELTHYHSFFSTLLTWQHPRATAITFGVSVLFIFACRYLPIMRMFFKMTWMTLGVVALAEIASKLVMGSGVAASVRPRKYYKLPKESLEASLDDLEQLINFFVIEVQRILFAENVVVTTAAFAAAFVSYYLVKLLPFWGMALLSTCVVFLAPLIYLQNQEFIDEHITHAHNVMTEQATQVKDLTAHHAGKGLESVKAYTGDAAAKAGEMVGSARQRIPLPASTKQESVSQDRISQDHVNQDRANQADFPTAPNSDLPSAAAADTVRPITHAPTEPEPIAASY